ncbi:MAG: ComF family protein, partial [Dehalococcoidia bacterium]|nr:ComF family protein [Dehalococcoidia bacterium]
MEGIRSPYILTGVMRQAIHAFKYRGISSLAPILGHLLADYLSENRLPVDVVVAVPLHPQRRKERGYDQAELLAGQLARELGLSLGRGWLVRQRPTKPQVKTASAAERARNVLGAFASTVRLEPGRSVLLVDDVCTTSATLTECARAVRGGKPKEIWSLAMA